MNGASFNSEKMYTYLRGYASGAGMKETRQYVLPLLRKVKNMYPEESDILFVLKYHIISVVDSIDATIQVFEQ